MKLCIDAGHNYSGVDTGAKGRISREQDNTYEIATRLGKLLRQAGHTVKLTREWAESNIGLSTSDSLNRRADISNAFGADLFVSIHNNAGGGVGAETYICASGGKAEGFARNIQSQLVSLGRVDRGVKTANFSVLTHTHAPAVLVEVGFIDNEQEEQWIVNHFDEIAVAIARGIGVDEKKEEGNVPLTVQKLDNIYIQEIYPLDFGIHVCDCKKRDVRVDNYFNLGYIAHISGGKTIPIGNLADSGNIICQSRDNVDWVNVAKKQLTTLYVKHDGSFGFTKTDTLEGKNIKTAVSGIPVVLGGKPATMEDVLAEGYFGSEWYDTWHGFLGLRGKDIVYVAAKCDFGQAPWLMIALGIRDAIKVDGGGSFILYNGREIVGTDENRRINNVGMWSM